MKTSSLPLFSLVAALMLAIFSAPIQSGASNWPVDPNENLPIATGPYEHLAPRITTDGAGGAILCWWDVRETSNWYDIYAQRVSRNGEILWITQGVPVCDAQGGQAKPQMVSDDEGGAIVAWEDERNPQVLDIYAQRVDPSGNVLWDSGGVAISVAIGNQKEVQLVSDGLGGAIITWTDFRAGQADIYAQRIDGSGSVLWTPDGVPICTQINDQVNPQLTTDGAGGAIIAWQDRRYFSTTLEDVFAQRVDADGNTVWTVDGIPITIAPLLQRQHRLALDGKGGAIVVWTSYAGYGDIYAQRVSADGIDQWTPGGVPLCTAADDQIFPQVLADGSSGAFICWSDDRPGAGGIYASRLDSTGAILWAADGVPVVTVPNGQDNPQLVADGDGGVIITWGDDRKVAFQPDIYAQRLDGNGNAQWLEGGVAISTANDWQWIPQLVSDGHGGAIITWEDYRNGEFARDVYAQYVGPNGGLGEVPTGIALGAGGSPRLLLHASIPNPFAEATVLPFDLAAPSSVTVEIFGVDGRRVFSEELSGLGKGRHNYAFFGRDRSGRLLPSGVYFYRVSAGSERATRRVVLLR